VFVARKATVLPLDDGALLLLSLGSVSSRLRASRLVSLVKVSLQEATWEHTRNRLGERKPGGCAASRECP
jgi:hypothetical protein